MKPVSVPQAAISAYPWAQIQVIGKPPGYSDEEIGGLPALIDKADSRFPTIRSYWQPSKDELAWLNLGGYIELDVVAHQMVPVALNVMPAESEAPAP